MRKQGCFVVDDNINSIEVLERYIRNEPDLVYLGSEANAEVACDLLLSGQVTPDILFLDIMMPRISGLDLKKRLPDNIVVVFTTGYGQYAVDAFDEDAIDYIVKPITYKRFYKAVKKAVTYIELKTRAQGDLILPEDFIYIIAENKRVKIDRSKIIYVESDDKTIKINLTDKVYVSKLALKEIEKLLMPPQFIRVHGSFIINRSMVIAYESRQVIMPEKVEIPVSRNFRKNLD